MVDVVVLSGDLSLFEAIRHAVGERNPVWRARSAEESVELLLTGRCGVLLIDMAAVSTRPATLVEQIVEQFPDLVVVVAGRRDDETLLARLISDGLVYRFMHKPLSPRRAGMFLNAAIRSHVERRENRSLAPLLPLMGGLRTRIELRKWLFVTVGLALFLTLLAAVLLDDRRAARPASAAVAAAPSRPAAPAPPRPLADPCCQGPGPPWRPGVTRPLPDAMRSISMRPCCSPDRHTRRHAPDLTRPRHAWWQWRPVKRRPVTLPRLADSSSACWRPIRATPRRERCKGDWTRTPAPVTEPPASLGRLPPIPLLRPLRLCRRRLPHRPWYRQCLQPSRPRSSQRRSPSRVSTAPRRVQVMPDPLTPRFAAPVATQSSSATSNRGSDRTFGPPINSGHPTAGYAKTLPAPEPIAHPDPAPPIDATGPLPDRDLEQLTATEPVYPPAALRDRVEGWVEVDFTVTEAGAVREIEIVAAERAASSKLPPRRPSANGASGHAWSTAGRCRSVRR